MRRSSHVLAAWLRAPLATRFSVLTSGIETNPAAVSIIASLIGLVGNPAAKHLDNEGRLQISECFKAEASALDAFEPRILN